MGTIKKLRQAINWKKIFATKIETKGLVQGIKSKLL